MSLSVQAVVTPAYTGSASARSENAPRSGPENTGVATKPSAQAAAQTEQDAKVIEQLKARDREVRAHEQAHVAAAGGLAQGGPSYTFQYGPDGQAYAVGGEVNIDTSAGRTPEETIAKAKQIRAAALAPADPSGQDRAVAAAAAQLEAQAQQEIAQAALSGLNPDQESPQENTGEVESAESSGASGSNATANTNARQAAALYGAIASVAAKGALINVSA